MKRLLLITTICISINMMKSANAWSNNPWINWNICVENCRLIRDACVQDYLRCGDENSADECTASLKMVQDICDPPYNHCMNLCGPKPPFKGTKYKYTPAAPPQPAEPRELI